MLTKSLENEFNYKRGLNIRGAPYDWRKAPNELQNFYNAEHQDIVIKKRKRETEGGSKKIKNKGGAATASKVPQPESAIGTGCIVKGNYLDVFKEYASKIIDYSNTFKVSKDPLSELTDYMTSKTNIPQYFKYTPKDPLKEKLEIYNQIYSGADGNREKIVIPMLELLSVKFNIYYGGVAALHAGLEKQKKNIDDQIRTYKETNVDKYPTYPQFAKDIINNSFIEEYIKYGYDTIYVSFKNTSQRADKNNTIMKEVQKILKSNTDISPFVVMNTFTNCVSIVIYGITMLEVYCYDYDFLAPDLISNNLGYIFLNLEDLLLMCYRTNTVNTTCFIPEKHVLIEFLEYVLENKYEEMRRRYKAILKDSNKLLTPADRNTLTFLHDKIEPGFKSKVETIIYTFLKPYILIYISNLEKDLNTHFSTDKIKILPAGGAVFNMYNAKDKSVPNDWDFKVYFLEDFTKEKIDRIFTFIAKYYSIFISSLYNYSSDLLNKLSDTCGGIFQNLRFQVRGTRAADITRQQLGWTGKVNLCSLDIFIDYYRNTHYVRSLVLSAVDIVIYDKVINDTNKYLIESVPYLISVIHKETDEDYIFKLPSIICSMCNILSTNILTRVFNKIQKDAKRFLQGDDIIEEFNKTPGIGNFETLKSNLQANSTVPVLSASFVYKYIPEQEGQIILPANKGDEEGGEKHMPVDAVTTLLDTLQDSPRRLVDKFTLPELIYKQANLKTSIFPETDQSGLTYFNTQKTEVIDIDEFYYSLYGKFDLLAYDINVDVEKIVNSCIEKKGRFSKIYNDQFEFADSAPTPDKITLLDEDVDVDESLPIPEADIKKLLEFFSSNERAIRRIKRSNTLEWFKTYYYDSLKSELDKNPSLKNLLITNDLLDDSTYNDKDALKQYILIQDNLKNLNQNNVPEKKKRNTKIKTNTTVGGVKTVTLWKQNKIKKTIDVKVQKQLHDINVMFKKILKGKKIKN
jgi:hypothetical protein